MYKFVLYVFLWSIMNGFLHKSAAAARKVLNFYVEGFRSMTVGKSLWVLIIFKLIILFLVLKLFFFPNVLEENYDDDTQRAGAVRSALTAH